MDATRGIASVTFPNRSSRIVGKWIRNDAVSRLTRSTSLKSGLYVAMEEDIGLMVGRVARGSLKTAVRFYRSLSSWRWERWIGIESFETAARSRGQRGHGKCQGTRNYGRTTRLTRSNDLWGRWYISKHRRMSLRPSRIHPIRRQINVLFARAMIKEYRSARV